MWSWLSNRVPGYQKIADRLGFYFSETDENKSVFNAFKNFKLFKMGSGRKVKYILTRKTQHETQWTFEYFYTISTGKSTATYIQHVFAVHCDISLASFYFYPQNFLHTIGKWFGMQDVEWKDFPDFNKNYMVKASSETEIRTFISEDVLGFLSYEKGWHIQAIENQIIFYKAGKRMNEEMVEPFIQVAETMYNILRGRQRLDSKNDS